MTSHFKVLYITYHKKVYSACLMILKNQALAEEAAQEAFTRAYESIDTLKDPSKFGAWVASIATKISINIYNRNKKIVSIETQGILD